MDKSNGTKTKALDIYHQKVDKMANDAGPQGRAATSVINILEDPIVTTTRALATVVRATDIVVLPTTAVVTQGTTATITGMIVTLAQTPNRAVAAALTNT